MKYYKERYPRKWKKHERKFQRIVGFSKKSNVSFNLDSSKRMSYREVIQSVESVK